MGQTSFFLGRHTFLEFAVFHIGHKMAFWGCMLACNVCHVGQTLFFGRTCLKFAVFRMGHKWADMLTCNNVCHKWLCFVMLACVQCLSNGT